MKQMLMDMDPNEHVVHEIKRHPIGLVFIFGGAAFISIAILAMVFLIINAQGSVGLEGIEIGLAVGAALLLILIAIFTYISAHIYRTNELVITNENIIQILQHSLFDRQVDHLNLAKIQNVTAQQNGLAPTFFGYGTVRIETAGEAANYSFSFTPNPNVVAKQIMEAHEVYIKEHPQTYRRL